MSADDESKTIDPESDDKTPTREKSMGFFGHLEDLRWTLVKCAVTFLVFASAIGYFLREFNDVLMWPLRSVMVDYPDLKLELGTTSVMEGFNVAIQMCILGGFMVSGPFLLFFLGQFVAPALTKKELKLVLPMCGAAGFLFLVGSAFSFYLLVPSTIRVSIEMNAYFNYVMRWTPDSYFTMMTWLVLGVGGAFEFPLVIVLLVWMGLMTTAFLRKYRRHAIVAIFVISAIITPTPDPVTQTMFAAPLYVLYEIAIIASSRVEKRRSRLERERENS